MPSPVLAGLPAGLSLVDLGNWLLAHPDEIAPLASAGPPGTMETFEAAVDAALAARPRTVVEPWRSDPAALAHHLTGGSYTLWSHTRFLSKKFVEAIRGIDVRQLWNQPSQTGKTTSLMHGAIWALDDDPSRRIMYVSYDSDKAVREAGEALDFARQHADELRFTLRPDIQARGRWNTRQGGGIYATGVGGSITGYPADVLLCFPGETLISTPSGPQRIDRLSQGGGKIVSYEHSSERAVIRQITGSRVSWATELVELRFRSGRHLVCTPEHPIWIAGRGYVEARLVEVGSEVRALGGPDLPGVQEGIPASGLRGGEAGTAGDRSALLLAGVSERDLPTRASVRHMREALGREAERPGQADRSSVLSVVSGGSPCQAAEAPREVMPHVWGDLPGCNEPADLLRQGVRRFRPFPADEGRRELALQGGRQPLRDPLFQDAGAHPGAGRRGVRGVPEDGRRSDRDAPHQRGPHRQPPGEPHHPLRVASHHAPQVGYDTVSMVRRVRHGSQPVYDLSVVGEHNLFAQGILAHNCDDLIKGWVEAHSERTCETTWNVYKSQMRLRLQSDTDPVIIAGTRWSMDDPTGMALKEQGQDVQRWTLIRIPHIAETPDPTAEIPEMRLPDPLGREPGEPLEKFSLPEIKARERTLGPYLAAGLEAQRPAPLEGGELKRSWWKWETSFPPEYQSAISSWDMKLKDKEAGDYVVGQVWGSTGADFWMEEMLRGQWGMGKTKLAIALLGVRHPYVNRHYIENSGNGPEVMQELRDGQDGYVVTDEYASDLGMTPAEREAVQSIMRSGMTGLIPVNAKGDKRVRARAESGILEGGSCHLLAGDPAAQYLVNEAATFPGKWDDAVDSWSQAMSKLRRSGATVQASSGQVTGARASATPPQSSRRSSVSSLPSPALGRFARGPR